jgi:hypothetical protein
MRNFVGIVRQRRRSRESRATVRHESRLAYSLLRPLRIGGAQDEGTNHCHFARREPPRRGGRRRVQRLGRLPHQRLAGRWGLLDSDSRFLLRSSELRGRLFRNGQLFGNIGRGGVPWRNGVFVRLARQHIRHKRPVKRIGVERRERTLQRRRGRRGSPHRWRCDSHRVRANLVRPG